MFFLAVMALLDPASISLGEEEEDEEEEQILDAGCIPAVGASVVIDEQDDLPSQSASVKDDQITQVFLIFA